MVATDKSNDIFLRSYVGGVLIFLYGLVWLAAALAGYLVAEPLFGSGDSLAAGLITATWAAALAGAMGGVTAMLTRLYKHLSIRQDFLEQSPLFYFLEPITGLIAGVLSLFIITIPGVLIVDFMSDLNSLIEKFSMSALNPILANLMTNLAEVSATSAFIAIYLLLAWSAGFYQQVGIEKLQAVTRRLIPTSPAEALETPTESAENDPLYFKVLYQQRRQMIRWSFTWGIFILLYGVAWLVGLLLSYLLVSPNSSNPTVSLVLAAWPVAAAGGCGGVFNIFYDLYDHVSVKQDFHRQHLMSYLVQPVVGFMLGVVIYLILATGYLTLTALANPEGAPAVVDSQAVIMAQLVVGWIAGFRQQMVAGILQGIIGGVLALFRKILAYLNPKNLFDKTKRPALQAETQEAQEASIFFQALNEAASARRGGRDRAQDSE